MGVIQNVRLSVRARTVSAAVVGARGARAVWLPIAVTAVALGVFDLASAYSSLARRGWLSASKPFVNARSRPPIYGYFRPSIAVAGLAALIVGLAVVFAVRTYAGRTRVRVAPFLACAMAGMLALCISVAFSNGRAGEALRVVKDTPTLNDARMASSLGSRTFVQSYPALVRTGISSIHSMTHPPGRVLAVAALRGAARHNAFGAALIMAILACLCVIPLFFAARRLGGERAAVVAVVLFAFAPGPLMFGFASHEAIETVIFLTAFAFALRAVQERDMRFAAASGCVLGLATFLTYATAFVSVAIGLYVVWMSARRDAVRLLAGAAIGGGAALLVLWGIFGFDVLSSYRASHAAIAALPATRPMYLSLTQRSYWYWLFGAPAGWLTFAGLPLAALGARRFFKERYLICFALPLVLFYVLPARLTQILPGELERTLQFFTPLVAIAAATVVVRAGEDRPRTLAWLAGIGIAQTLILEALFFNFW